MENDEKELEKSEELEELLKRLRLSNNWSYAEVSERINKNLLKKKEEEKSEKDIDWLIDKDVKKWEYGIKYPDLDMIYELSELYEVKCDDFVQAKNISLKRGFPSLTTIKWTCYFLNVSIYVGLVINVLVIFLAAILSMMFFGHVILEIPKKL